ncbi:non-hydrolyzing UDP-N-acetylglucosamine 2-epimerase [Curtobacterium flaccumfaciens]|uniref:non-hydrolyzing UDP-N-acetylglucosamine 2-epimerase n=1 Tax=Curtobacterium flaccumfaciens TaxID=2035 RepID=UPI002201B7B9|nr:UDP-N-acetylglucosamine 2-epimerase (non-hydrolyzing) [Curtobacterium flaccumfaciens]UWD79302.1 UDP-N-acetylglucosamine 2-epimerase (non-hydrolyzing) [Curtobacterium flaccumfaciens]
MHTPDIAIILGTRPEIIKMAPVIRLLGNRALVIHSGQHYDERMSGQHFSSLGLPQPDVVLAGIGGTHRADQISNMMRSLVVTLQERRPKTVLVQGDTNTVSAGAQAAHYLNIPVIHVEAGLRSNDREMPEEINRIITGAVASVHCAATAANASNLMREGTPASAIAVTGNTIVEATLQALSATSKSIDSWFSGARPARYAVATIHRPENTDRRERLEEVLIALGRIDIPVVFLIHPRTRAAIERFDLEDLLDRLIVREAPNSTDFLNLASGASVLVSDSGGVQEESTILKVPLAVVRRSTERPEAIDAGFAWLIKPGMDIAREVNVILSNHRVRAALAASSSPFGDGKASERIAAIAVAIADGASPEDAIGAVMSELTPRMASVAA